MKSSGSSLKPYFHNTSYQVIDFNGNYFDEVISKEILDKILTQENTTFDAKHTMSLKQSGDMAHITYHHNLKNRNANNSVKKSIFTKYPTLNNSKVSLVNLSPTIPKSQTLRNDPSIFTTKTSINNRY